MTALVSILAVTAVAVAAMVVVSVPPLRRNAAARHAVLLCAVFAVAAAPLLALAARAMPPLPAATIILALDGRPALTIGPGGGAPTNRADDQSSASVGPTYPDTRSALPLRSILMATWAAGSLLLLARLWVSAVRCVRLVRRSTDERLVDGCRVRISRDIDAPVCVGWFAPVVLLPRGLTDIVDVGQLGQVLAHESAHARRRDAWVVLLERLVAAAWWFHPLVHILNRALDGAREQRCDDHVLARGYASRDYARTLLRIAEWREGIRRTPCTALAVGLLCRGGSSRLRRRVVGLLDERRNPMIRCKPVYALTAAIGFASVALLVSCAASGPRQAAKPASGIEPLKFFEIPVEIGDSDLGNGDKIHIDHVLCTADTMRPEEICIVRGTYVLASHDSADLSFYITSKGYSGPTPVDRRQILPVKRGSGSFELRHVLSEGWPHLSYYADGGSIGGVYFGQGDSLLKVMPWKKANS